MKLEKVSSYVKIEQAENFKFKNKLFWILEFSINYNWLLKVIKKLIPKYINEK